ncbi:MAG: amidase [Acidobacteria bacterium]|nr:amidase [Acidobacteriota bacterium]
MAPFNDDVFFATIPELNAALRARKFSAVELARAFSERLEKLGPRYNALALSLREQAIRQAKNADDDLRRERFRGPLQGIPYGAKDLLAVAGQPTTWGAKPYAGQVFGFDATAVQKLNKSGAVLTGKLSMVELAGGGGYRYAAASLQGPGLNPWDLGRWSGGSSSGTGSAVAAGLVTFGLGSETSGSILTPSAYCGVTGLRPTYGLVSRYGAMALAWTMDKIGPMCRSAEDCGLVLQIISGGDSKDPASAGKSFYFGPRYAPKPDQIRVGWAPPDFFEAPEESVRPVFQQAVEAVRSLGVQISDVRLPDLPYGLVTSTVISAEGAAVFEPLIASGKVDELADKKQIAGLKAGLDIAAKDYLKAMRIRSEIQQAFRKLFSQVDVLLAPARPGPATKIDEPLDAASNRPQPKDPGLRALIPAGNCAGLPALSLPCGFVGGLPLAIQLVGRPFSENTLLSLGKEFQSRTDWHRRRPR